MTEDNKDGWKVVTENSYGGVYERKDGTIVTGTWNGTGMEYKVQGDGKNRLLHTYPFLEQEFSKSLDTAYDMGIEHCLDVLKTWESIYIPPELITSLTKLKKDNNG